MGPLVLALTIAATTLTFRDASLESRCEELKAFVAEFHAPDKTFKAGGCGEGNGLGGALYTLDFKAGAAAVDHRITIAFENDGPVKVTVKPPLDSLEGAVAKWAGGKPAALKIFGKPYDEFIKGILAYKGYFPVLKHDKPGTLRFTLVPDSGLKEGKVRFEDKVDAEFLKCFQCPDVKCLNDEVRYRFQDRFFALTRNASENAGAGWIVDGSLPIGEGGSAWKFVCGVSRYSLENVTL